MNLQKILNRLEKKHPKKIDLSLERTFNLLKKLGNPQKKIKNVISVVGTNGKYSTIKILQSFLNQAGYKCNIFLSPHLQSYSERYIYDDKEISEDNLTYLLNEIDQINKTGNLTLFEALTCAYLKYCEQFKDNITIIEAGLFHQYDATNVFKKNLCSIITSINLDHLQWLKKKTIEGIIHEKTISLLPSNIFISKQENHKILHKIKDALKNKNANKFFYGHDFNYVNLENNYFKYRDTKDNFIVSRKNILGEHQLNNMSTAIMTARTMFNIKKSDIKKAAIKINMKGRLQEIKTGLLKNIAKKNKLILDGGHNVNAANSIAKWIKSLDKDVHLIVGMMKDKDHKKFISAFKNKIKSLTLIDIPNQNGSISKEDFKSKIQNIFPIIYTANSIEKAIMNNAKKSKNSYIIIIGSLYLAGEVLNLN